MLVIVSPERRQDNKARDSLLIFSAKLRIFSHHNYNRFKYKYINNLRFDKFEEIKPKNGFYYLNNQSFLFQNSSFPKTGSRRKSRNTKVTKRNTEQTGNIIFNYWSHLVVFLCGQKNINLTSPSNMVETSIGHLIPFKIAWET